MTTELTFDLDNDDNIFFPNCQFVIINSTNEIAVNQTWIKGANLLVLNAIASDFKDTHDNYDSDIVFSMSFDMITDNLNDCLKKTPIVFDYRYEYIDDKQYITDIIDITDAKFIIIQKYNKHCDCAYAIKLESKTIIGWSY